MRKALSTLLTAICICASCFGAHKAKTAFAIIIDDKTYSECREEVDAYAAVLELEGLKTYIVSEAWNRPEEVRERILELSRRKPALEGIVLIGDVPIVMVRGAQFMTTAFKMDEKAFPIFESSVASDRYYDDFDLRFDFIEKDPEHDNIFYYRLSESSTTVLHPDIYSARMKVPEIMDGDRYDIMRRYLGKVVAAHREQDNTLDHLIYYAGYGYNSDCLTVWRQKPVLFKEAFPYAFTRASGNRFLDFREDSQMKWKLFNEMQRPGTDVFQFSEHGDFDKQYINDDNEAALSFEDCLFSLKADLADSYKRYKGTEEEAEFLHEADSLFHIESSAFSDSALVSYSEISREKARNSVISAQELTRIKSESRIVILNACYNGSFHNPKGYVAGCHVFGEGGCIVAQGNTVNVLQDKWEDELIAYLSIGERVGMWQKELCWLESHLIGDPTFRFSPHNSKEADDCAGLHHNLIFHSSDTKVWRKYAKSGNAWERAAGIVHLGYLGRPEDSDLALAMLENDPSPMVREHALNVLWSYADANAVNAVNAGLGDPCELIVRTAARMAGAIGSEETIPALNAVSREHPDMIRASYQADNAMSVIIGKNEGERASKAMDKALKAKQRISMLRTFRNYNSPSATGALISIVKDDSDELEVRYAAAEALGWFSSSVSRNGITEALKGYVPDDPELARLIGISLKRLEKK